MELYHFLNQDGEFTLKNPDRVSGLYFPIANEIGLKSSVTPNFGGDAKLDQDHFLLEPVSACDLANRRSSRNFWVRFADGHIWSATGVSAEAESRKFTDLEEDTILTAGFLYQKVERFSKTDSIASEIIIFAPLDANMELMTVTIRNTGKEPMTLTPTAAVPIYGRSASNVRDHRHVTAMLNRIRTTEME